MNKRILFYYFIGVFAPYCIVMAVSNYYFIAYNESDSLPQRVFLVKKRETSFKRGDYIVFRKKSLEKYNQAFIKLVAGVGGDQVDVKGDDYAINNQHLGTAKKFRKTGVPTNTSEGGIIPNGKYFVYAPHKDSFDSRYEEIGWIDSSDVIGRAYPIF